jgi:hypothetical protein
MIHQLEPEAPSHASFAIPDLMVNPTSIVGSVSDGLDSDACALWARQSWPDHPLIL